MIAWVATVPAVIGATSMSNMRRKELVLVAPVRGWIVAAWAKTFAPKKRQRFQKFEPAERGTQFVGENDSVAFAMFRPVPSDKDIMECASNPRLLDYYWRDNFNDEESRLLSARATRINQLRREFDIY